MLEEVSQFCVNPMEMPVTAWWRPLDIYVFYQAGYRKLTSLQCANIDVVKKTCSQLNWSIVWSPRKPSELSSIPAKRPKYIKPRQWFDGVLALHKMTAMRFKIDHYHSWDCIAVPWNVLLDVQLLPGLTVNVSDSIRVSVQQTTLVCLIALSIVPLRASCGELREPRVVSWIFDVYLFRNCWINMCLGFHEYLSSQHGSNNTTSNGREACW